MKSESLLLLSGIELQNTPENGPQAGSGLPAVPNPMPDERNSPQVQERSQRYRGEKKLHTRDLTNSHPDPLLTVGEFADQLRVTRACVRKWILTRKVGVVKIGRLVRLRSSELRRIVDEGSRPPVYTR
jgi:excisionase family DNA binding protein